MLCLAPVRSKLPLKINSLMKILTLVTNISSLLFFTLFVQRSCICLIIFLNIAEQLRNPYGVHTTQYLIEDDYFAPFEQRFSPIPIIVGLV